MLSRLVAGNEKFLIMVLGALQAFVSEGPYITEPATKVLVVSLMVACQGWLGTNTITASSPKSTSDVLSRLREAKEVVVEGKKVVAEEKPRPTKKVA